MKMHPTAIDTSSRYSVFQYPGIAFRVTGPTQESTEEAWEIICDEDDCDHASDMCYIYNEPEMVDSDYQVDAVMIGDDRVFHVYVDDLELIDDESYCRDCGQIGCTANTYA